MLMNCIVILEHITLLQLRSVVLVYDILIMTSFFIKIHRKDKINDNQIMFDHLNLSVPVYVHCQIFTGSWKTDLVSF